MIDKMLFMMLYPTLLLHRSSKSKNLSLQFDALQQLSYTALQHPYEDVFLYTLL
jgi:hypothetical protein